MTADAARPGRIGRPPRIDRTAIAEAVLELGLDGISMKAVADHLGVSVAGLYHHVANRHELLVLAAERSLSRTPGRPRITGSTGTSGFTNGPATSTAPSCTSRRSCRNG